MQDECVRLEVHTSFEKSGLGSRTGRHESLTGVAQFFRPIFCLNTALSVNKSLFMPASSSCVCVCGVPIDSGV